MRAGEVGIRIETAAPDDCGAIGELHVRSVQQAYRSIMPAEHLASRTAAQSEAFWRDLIVRGKAELLVARAESLLGFVALGPSRDPEATPLCGEIWAIYVAPEMWGKGAGRQLCTAAVADLHARGYTRVMLWVLARNERALHFYRAVGFEVDTASEQDFEVAGERVREVRCVFRGPRADT